MSKHSGLVDRAGNTKIKPRVAFVSYIMIPVQSVKVVPTRVSIGTDGLRWSDW